VSAAGVSVKKCRVFRKKTVKCTKMPDPRQFFSETTAVDAHTLCSTYLDIWGCLVWV